MHSNIICPACAARRPYGLCQLFIMAKLTTFCLSNTLQGLLQYPVACMFCNAQVHLKMSLHVQQEVQQLEQS